MGTYARDNTEVAIDIDGLGTQHRAEEGGMTIAFESWRKGLDTGEMFAELPSKSCQEPHWGYMVSGQITIRYDDGAADVLVPGRAYHIRPGHNAHVDEDCDLVEFTRADDTPGINTISG